MQIYRTFALCKCNSNAQNIPKMSTFVWIFAKQALHDFYVHPAAAMDYNTYSKFSIDYKIYSKT